MSIKASILAFTPTIHGFKVLTDKGTYYVSRQAFPSGIAPGMEIMFNEHKAGDPYPVHFGREGKFKVSGIHDIMISKTVSKALLYENNLVAIEEEA